MAFDIALSSPGSGFNIALTQATEWTSDPVDTATVTDSLSISFDKGILTETVGASDFISFELVTPGAGLVLRTVKGSALTVVELDDNFNLINNKTERILSSISSSSSITPVGTDYSVTALAINATINAFGETAWDGQPLVLKIKDDGTPRTLNWNAIYRAIGLSLPIITIAGVPMYFGMVYNDADSKWDVIAYTTIN